MFSLVSYFCGCGGLDLGFRGDFEYKGHYYPHQPFNLLAAYDNNNACIETYNRYFGKGGHVADLSDADPANIPAADVLIGGFPCQDFSSCGPQRGLSSERGRLYQTMIRYMEYHKPRVVVGENVINLKRMDEGTVINTIITDIEKAGYRVNVWQLYGPEYGIPQTRNRLFFVCVRNDLKGMPASPERLYSDDFRSIEWAIGDLINVVDESVPNQSQYFAAAKAKKGNGQGDEVNQRNQPAYTIRANPKSRVHFHYELDRRLTVRECARIQTFPDDFVFTHSMTTSISQIGNAVPPVLAYIVAQQIALYLVRQEG
ncbi:MAG: DNA cytosine methyltransferase [Clostridiales bacterium]|nr:DNA cytosine methyltransferase [Clostridiales bacterium]MBR3874183.1 DNA cytosine methyltransferase [Clostridia bacterium]